MANDFNNWLDNLILELNSGAQKSSSIIVASVIGKEVADLTKSDLINRYLGKEIFKDKWSQQDTSNQHVSIDVYYDEMESVLWLLVNGIYDVNIQHRIFEELNFKGKSFFEKISETESAQKQLLTFIFLISHIILFVEQSARFDVDWVHMLEDINRQRRIATQSIKNTLAELSIEQQNHRLPAVFQENGRIALPKLLFCFCRNPLRSDLNVSKKKELLEKMEKCLESQISHLLRSHGLIENRCAENALAQVTISTGIPFVYIFNHNELPKNAHNEFVLALYPEESVEESNITDLQNLITEMLEFTPKDKEKLNRVDYNFDYFLHTALSNSHQEMLNAIDGEKCPTTIQPLTIANFIETAKILRDLLVGKQAIANPMIPIQEMFTLTSIIETSIRSGISLYRNQLYRQSEVTGGGDAVFSKLEHEYTLKMAIEQLQLMNTCPKAMGKGRREQMADQIEQECTALWVDGHQRCSEFSLTGQLCHYGIHEPSDITNFDQTSSLEVHHQQQLKRSHCSGVKTYSMCNCGLTRQIRVDPFTLKEANFGFYQRTDYTFGSCCVDLDRYEFHLFDPRNATHSPSFSSAQKGDTSANQTNTDTNRNSPKQQEMMAEQLLEADEDDGIAIDPHEFNIRFFDDEDEQIPSEEEEETVEGKITHPEQGSMFVEEPKTQEEAAFSEDNEEEEEEQRRKERIESTEEDEEAEDEEAEGMEADASRAASTEHVNYLESYDERRGSTDNQVRKDRSALGMEKDELLEKYSGCYLDHVPHSNSPPGLLPMFPSFSVVCIGHSSLYNHSTGIRETPNFRSGSEFLLPWNIQLTVNTEQWLRELQFIGATPTERTLRTLQQQQRRIDRRSETTSKEKVKLFIGFDYECPRGHRFMISEPGKVLRHRRASGPLKMDASPLLNNDLSIWMPCPCKKEPRVVAQLMRIHIVTPKAPVSVFVQPLIQMPEDDGYFFPGYAERIELGWAKYYVMRLPYAYVGPSRTPTYRPNTPEFKGRLLRNCIRVDYLPLSDV